MPNLRWCTPLAWLVAPTLAAAIAAQQFDDARFARNLQPLVGRYCGECHSNAKQKGDLDLERFASLASLRREPEVWQQVFEHLRSGDMPPADKLQPTAAERASMLAEVDAVLAELAQADAGDPGPVLLRRLSNAEYTFTIRDLTGVDALDPAREFPVDGAAGEGFTNVGHALVISPALLTKYFDAAKAIAEHAVLVPDGIRFATGTTRRDATEEVLAGIRALHRRYTDDSAGDAVDLQGIVFTTNGGGRLPLARYLTAALACRDGADVVVSARAAGLSAKYLRILLQELTTPTRSPLLAHLGASFRRARVDDVPTLAAEITQWQRALWQFRSVGHIGKLDGPKAWMEPVDALLPRRELRMALPTTPSDAASTVYLVARTAGLDTATTGVVWQEPRLRAPGRPDLPLRDVRAAARGLERRRDRMLGQAARCLAAADAASLAGNAADVAVLAQRHGVAADALAAWLEVLGIGPRGPVVVDGLFTEPLAKAADAEAVRGWGKPDTPSLVTNASSQPLRIPGLLKAHGVALHPSPKARAAVGWRSPVAATVQIDAVVEHVHHDCGNGVAWAIELRRGQTRQRLADGVAHRDQVARPAAIVDLVVMPGDLLSVLVAARDGDHTCDLTAVDCVITTGGASPMRWDLAADVADDVLAGNPHADRLGHADVWHFYSEADGDHGAVPRAIPPGSLLAQWSTAASGAERARLATAVQDLLTAGTTTTVAADIELRRQLRAADGVLLGGATLDELVAAGAAAPEGAEAAFGLDPAAFGTDGAGAAIDATSVWMPAPSVLAIAIPAELAAGRELVTTGALDAASRAEGCVQLQVSATPPAPLAAHDASLLPGEPIVAEPGSAAWTRTTEALAAFRRVFPAAVCYAKIVPVDEVVTLTLFHREDEPLLRLVLEDDEARRLDRLWQELRFLSQDALTLVDAFDQIWQFATQDGDPKVFEPLREPIRERAAAFRRELAAAEPKHVDGVLEFADRAWRRPLTADEQEQLRALYRRLRDEGLAHDEVIRLLLARVLIAPAFLYRSEVPGPGAMAVPVTDHELASRLSYFLGASLPDAGLRTLAAAGRLRDPDVLAAEARRLLGDARMRRFAREFACAWLHLADFDSATEKSERHFPTFAGLRASMQEEVVRFFTDLCQRDGSVLDVLAADHTFVDPALATHYGLAIAPGDGWQRVAGLRAHGRGGVLGMAAVLAAQSGASRTSPILRGNWVSEVLLGERLPRPPKDVPRLPDDDGALRLSMRELTARHSSDARCAHCHARIDGFGFALEAFDAIGRWRERDVDEQAIDTRGTSFDGAQFTGLAGLRDHLLGARRDAFLRQFLRKLLGYALGRAVQLSDRPLLDAVLAAWPAHDHRIGFAIEAIVRSRQFREIRGRDAKTGH